MQEHDEATDLAATIIGLLDSLPSRDLAHLALDPTGHVPAWYREVLGGEALARTGDQFSYVVRLFLRWRRETGEE